MISSQDFRKISLKKGFFIINIQYSNHASYNTTLFAEEACVEFNDLAMTFSMDLMKNLKTRNKEENTYYDAIELTRKKNYLSKIQISDPTIYKRLKKIVSKSDKPDLEIFLILENPIKAKATLFMEESTTTVLFEIIKILF